MRSFHSFSRARFGGNSIVRFLNYILLRLSLLVCNVFCLNLEENCLLRSKMKLPRSHLRNICSLLYIVQTVCTVTATQFASHVSVNTPALSFSHGVGDPVSVLERRAYHRLQQSPPIRKLRRPTSQSHGGYPRQKPAIPFQVEDAHRGNSLSRPWLYNSYKAIPLQVLPPSPYKVDSPDPESLWPIGLFIPPVAPQRYGPHRRSDAHVTGSDPEDPYLLEGSEAVAAVTKSTLHGHLYFHDIPHIDSLLANQEIRVQNNLKPHRIASIRQTWPFNRP
ncbi:uncharacterized protein LOC112050323 [Bicyclus anynana]|uniref:Uncharacterized protein LOC112050323 n=1 Tax=Bicyclus anynana TaxID=110368 RepID=A0A6J1N9E5_BICAN|nr:uncharacterized protein LOC112050323 [Bicyclus anynana]